MIHLDAKILVVTGKSTKISPIKILYYTIVAKGYIYNSKSMYNIIKYGST